MPVMDGRGASGVRQRWPGLPAIVFDAHHAGRRVTLDALALGASDYVLKPSSTDPGSAMAEVGRSCSRIAALLPQAREARERTTRPTERRRASGTVRRPAARPSGST